MHPSRAEFFEWDEGNEQELRDHAISADEVEEVFENDPLVAAQQAGPGR